MYHQRIDSALAACEKHLLTLDKSNINNNEIETYLVAGLVVLIVSEYEEHLENVFVKRAKKCGDDFASNFIKNTLSQKFRSPDLSKINDTLKLFDDTYRDVFKKEIENSPNHAAWDSIMKARHAVVHKKGMLNITFRELKEKYTLTRNIIENVEDVLGVKS